MARALILTALIFALAAPAHGQSRRELAQVQGQLSARIAELEARASTSDTLLEELLVRLQTLEQEQRALTGEIERLNFENRQLQAQLDRALSAASAEGLDLPTALGANPASEDGGASGEGLAIVDPDDPFAQARAAATQPLGSPQGQGAGAPGGPIDLGGAARPTLEPEPLFTEGRDQLLAGDFLGAQETFEAFVEVYPDNALVGEAWYWLGETYFVQGDFSEAAESYLASLRLDEDGARAPDALVRLAGSLAALDQLEQACQALAGFESQFPNASAEARRKAEREAARAGCS